jgi:MFS family permease
MSRSTTSLASRPESKDKPIELTDASDIEQQALSPTKEAHGPGAGGPGVGGPPGENDLYKPKTLKFWSILLSNFLALFLVALDRTILATAVPRITDEFKSLGDIGWYASSYMLTTSCAQLIFGRIYKHYDMKWTFLISIIFFEIGSAICGAAPNSPSFIAGRAIAGAASAGIFSGCMMIMIPMIPLAKRPMFQGLFGMVFGLASVLGPLIGGGFTASISWRYGSP